MSSVVSKTKPAIAINIKSNSNTIGGNGTYSTERQDCFVTKTYGELKAGGIAGIVSFFQAACRSPDFVTKCKGFETPCFLSNFQLVPGNSAFQKFEQALQDLDDEATLGLVFHGTPANNIPDICRDGLNPEKRRGQAYGPGEYFSKDPGISISYCRGGSEMLVFVVVLPSAKSTNDTETGSTNAIVPLPFFPSNAGAPANAGSTSSANTTSMDAKNSAGAVVAAAVAATGHSRAVNLHGLPRVPQLTDFMAPSIFSATATTPGDGIQRLLMASSRTHRAMHLSSKTSQGVAPTSATASASAPPFNFAASSAAIAASSSALSVTALSAAASSASSAAASSVTSATAPSVSSTTASTASSGTASSASSSAASSAPVPPVPTRMENGRDRLARQRRLQTLHRLGKCPPQYVVVNNNNHQLPIGTMTFTHVDQKVMCNSQQLRKRLLSLNQEVEDRIKAAEEAQLKSEIIQLLIARNIDEASHMYIEHRNTLSELTKKEISWYVRTAVGNDDRFAVFFPDLPQPMNNTEISKVGVQSVDYAMMHETQAKHQLANAQKTLAKSQEKEISSSRTENGCPKSPNGGKSKAGKSALKRPRDATSVIAAIMENLSSQRMDVASELYLRRGALLDAFAKRELAQCVHRCVDDPSLVPILFPDLPEPESPKKAVPPGLSTSCRPSSRC